MLGRTKEKKRKDIRERVTRDSSLLSHSARSSSPCLPLLSSFLRLSLPPRKMDSEYAQAHATTEQQKQEQAPAHSNIGKQASSSSSSLAKQGNGDLKSLLEKQLATFDSFFENFNKSSFSHLDSLLSNEPAFAWQIRPLSLYPDVFTKSGLEYKKDEVGDLFRQMKEKLLKDIQVRRLYPLPHRVSNDRSPSDS